MSWDKGLTALDAGIDVQAPEGIAIDGDLLDLAEVAMAWFERNIRRWKAAA